MPDVKPDRTAQALDRLLSIMATLRDPEKGCPWDKRQTMSSLTRFTIEEAYEVADAIAENDISSVRDELGDLLFQVVFYAQIAKEDEHFDFADVATAISDKLIRRHPHVFGDKNIDEAELARQWEDIKAQEKREQGIVQESLLDTVPRGLPALMFAHKLQKKCASVGFDWPDIGPVLEKVEEELNEVKSELTAPTLDQQALEEEIGDALFAMVNVARHCQVDADKALRNASHKFAARFRMVEKYAKHNHQQLDHMTLAEMEELWQRAKKNLPVE